MGRSADELRSPIAVLRIIGVAFIKTHCTMEKYFKSVYQIPSVSFPFEEAQSLRLYNKGKQSDVNVRLLETVRIN